MLQKVNGVQKPNLRYITVSNSLWLVCVLTEGLSYVRFGFTNLLRQILTTYSCIV